MTSGISVLILTKNEQQDLPGCLDSVAWSNDVHVLDSGSTDQTTSIALAKGAKISARDFDGYASQRNAGLRLAFLNPWVLVLDADERIPEPLAQELSAFVQQASTAIAGVRMKRRDIWWGRWLKHAQISPFYVRLVRVGRAHYEREINEVMVVDGDIADMTNSFDHYPFSKGLDHWISKHNTYSHMEAQVIASGQRGQPSWRKAFFASDFNERRVHQKSLFYALPGRPFIKLAYMLLVRRAGLDGWAGVRYAVLQSIYEYFIVLKTREIQMRTMGQDEAHLS
jgi:glycosyltransferase involved in cell wall biosynthesis